MTTEPAASDLLTVSRLRAYRKCSRLEHLLYVEGWRSAVDAEALAFGSLWHRGMEAWWHAHREGDITGALDRALSAVAGRATDAFIQVRCDELLRGYDAHWRGQGLEVVGVEEEFRAPLINPETMQPSRTWRLAGKIDARARAEGRRLIVEHKTSSEDISPAADYWLKLQMDHQLSIYMIGAEALGWPPDGTLYDVVLKPTQRPGKATPEAERKYKKDGTLYATQRDHDETAEEYRGRVREAIEAEPTRYFQRREIPRTESQLAEFLADVWAQGRDMREAHLAGRSPRNPEACFAYGKCPMWEVCSAGVDPAEHPIRYRRVDHVHPELTQDHAA